MKRAICILVAALLLTSLFSGCFNTTDNELKSSNDQNMEEVTKLSLCGDGIPMPQNPGNSLVEYVPGREFFVNCNNIDTVHYGMGEYVFCFKLFTKREVDSNAIKISISCKNNYTYSVTQESINLRDTEYSAGYETGTISGPFYLPYYVYQNYRGTDFVLAEKLWDLYLYPPEDGSEEAIKAEALINHKTPLAAYEAVINEALDGYKALTSEDTREFYVYTVWVTFDVVVDEVITNIDVNIENQQICQEIGKLHLVPTMIPSTHPHTNDLKTNGMPVLSFATNLYGDGMAELFLFDLIAEKDITLTGMRFLDDVTEILEINLTVLSGGNIITCVWDGKTPICLFEGDEIIVNAVIKNENLVGLFYYVDLNYELLMKINGENFSKANCLNMSPINMSYHEIYAIVFDGLDMESYYKDYYYPVFESWRAEYAD